MKPLSSALLVLLVILFPLSAAWPAERIAVLDFKSILAPPELGAAVAEILRTELVETGGYLVIERGMLEQVIQEQKLQLSGTVDAKTAITIGKFVGADMVVIGSIIKTGVVYTINSRFIDVETGVAKMGRNIRREGEDQISDMVHELVLILTEKKVETAPAPAKTPVQAPAPKVESRVPPKKAAPPAQPSQEPVSASQEREELRRRIKSRLMKK